MKAVVVPELLRDDSKSAAAAAGVDDGDEDKCQLTQWFPSDFASQPLQELQQQEKKLKAITRSWLKQIKIVTFLVYIL